MGKVIKNIAFVLGILALSSLIFFLVSQNDKFSDDLFERSLRVLGEQLLSRLPEKNAKRVVAEKWQDFSEKAINGDIPAERVERVAVSILNASNSDEELSFDDAEIILSLAESQVATVVSIQPLALGESRHDPESENFGDYREQNKERCSELGKELVIVCDFNEKIKKSLQHNVTRLTNHLKYRVDNGLKIKADLSLKDALENMEFVDLSQEIQRLHGEKILEWRQGFVKEMAAEKVHLRLSLDSLKIALLAENLVDLKELKKLEKLRDWQIIGTDGIQKLVFEAAKKSEVETKVN